MSATIIAFPAGRVATRPDTPWLFAFLFCGGMQ